ncbi:YceI family protein [uncultured Sunxiuqinia sp.]|uniref:YceI family protein n=1 Tax=uncultured Sunxiuqinia sp. TaxID=1573825 RepID=UPI0030DC5DB8
MKTLTYIIILALNLFATHVVAQGTVWVEDEAHSSIKFSAIHMGISEVEGNFKDFDIKVVSNEADFTDAKIEVTIQANSLDTDNTKRDDHLKSDDFLGVEKYPVIKFTSESLTKISDGKYQLTGTLTIRDVTKTETFDVSHMGTVEAMGETRAGFKLTGSIQRFDYNVDWNKTFTKGMVVSKEIDIVCNFELNKK